MQLIVRLILMDTHCCDLQSFTDIIYSNANELVNHSRQSCPIKRGTNHPLFLAGPRGDPAERERRQETRPDDFLGGRQRERVSNHMMSVVGAQPFIKPMQPAPSVSPGIQRRHTLPASEVRPLNTQDAISVFEIEREGK